MVITIIFNIYANKNENQINIENSILWFNKKLYESLWLYCSQNIPVKNGALPIMINSGNTYLKTGKLSSWKGFRENYPPFPFLYLPFSATSPSLWQWLTCCGENFGSTWLDDLTQYSGKTVRVCNEWILHARVKLYY